MWQCLRGGTNPAAASFALVVAVTPADVSTAAICGGGTSSSVWTQDVDSNYLVKISYRQLLECAVTGIFALCHGISFFALVVVVFLR